MPLNHWHSSGLILNSLSVYKIYLFALNIATMKLVTDSWDEDGGKTSINGSVLLKGVPLMGENCRNKVEGKNIGKEKRNIGKEEKRRLVTGYIIQTQVMSMVMGLVDDEDGCNGPQYMRETRM